MQNFIPLHSHHIMARGDRKRKLATILPAAHYIEAAKRHKEDKDVFTNYAQSTRKQIESAYKHWVKYCTQQDMRTLTWADHALLNSYCTLLEKNPDELLELCDISWFKSFLQWLLDTSPNIRKQSTVHQVWKYLRLCRMEKHGKMDAHISLQVTNVRRDKNVS